MDIPPLDPKLPGAESGSRRFDPAGVLLFLVVAAVFLGTLHQGFITYDDPVYVTDNPHVTGGLTAADLGWAFRSTEASNWHPLTWISLQADSQVYGRRAGGFHLTNVLLHALDALLLFIVLRRMTAAPGRSLLVAALFGLHPLHVESVAWISERKDVLSTFFLFLTLGAYGRRSEFLRMGDRRAGRYYLLALVLFAAGLLCKPMLVTLPCLLLLLDYWPLGRWPPASAGGRVRLVLEKLPFFALSAVSSAVTLRVQRLGGAVATLEEFRWPARLANALVSYVWYLRKCFVPTRLAIFYPSFAEVPGTRETLLAGAILIGITAGCLLLRRRSPYLLFGWLWFLGTLVPVIGVVQVGGQAMADRYSYVPLIGIFIMVAWGASDLLAPSKARKAAALLGAALVGACAAATFHQLGYWRDGVRLFRHAAAVTANNWVAHANLAATLAGSSDPGAKAEYDETLHILATFAEGYLRKGAALEKTPGHLAEATKDYRLAVEILPVLASAHNQLGAALARTPGGTTEAIAELRTAIRLNPTSVAAHFNLAATLASRPESQAESIAEFQTVLAYAPDDVMAHFFLARVLARNPDNRNEVIAHLEAALQVRPGFSPARQMLEHLQATGP
jgi:tetratricopeptide (TPR) repeat protein